MARLNEPPAGVAESLESLKRRFIIQNQGLAKSNSSQAVKIRALSGEIARLTAENVSLRKTVAQLEHELQHHQDESISTAATNIQERLEAGLVEMKQLLADVANRRAGRRTASSSKRQENTATKRRDSSISALFATDEGKLPTIVEGKHFPRKTMESTEIQSILSQQGSDSPDIGPPPSTSYVQNEILLDTDRSSKANNSDQNFPDLMSVNLETRRRRKDPHRLSSEGLREESTAPAGDSAKTSTSEGFASKPIRTAKKPQETPAETANRVQPQSPRKALAPKSINTSPRKPTQPDSNSSKSLEKASPSRSTQTLSRKPSKTEAGNATEPSKLSPSRSIKPVASTSRSQGIFVDPVKTQNEVQVVEVSLDLAKNDPITPSTIDLFSPPSTDASQAKSKSANSKPGSFQANEPMPAGRVSRRARANISYAEPSLNTKMRRPASEWSDAVSSTNRLSTGEKPEPQSETKDAMPETQPKRIIAVKREGPEVQEERPVGTKVEFSDAQKSPPRRDPPRTSQRSPPTSPSLRKTEKSPPRSLGSQDKAGSPPRPLSSRGSQFLVSDQRQAPSTSDSRPSSRGKEDAEPQPRSSIQRTTSLNRPSVRRQTLAGSDGSVKPSVEGQSRSREARQLKGAQSSRALSANAGETEAISTAAERGMKRRRSMMI